MNRRDFLKSLLGITASVALPGLVFANKPKPWIGVDPGKDSATIIQNPGGFLEGEFIHIENAGYFRITGITNDTFTVAPRKGVHFKEKPELKLRHDYWNQGRRW